jgi:ATP-dependent RNA helicase DDX31/DBP7
MHHGDLKECLKKYLQMNVEIKTGAIMYNYIDHKFISGLTAFRLYRETRHSSWMDTGIESTQTMRIWAFEGSSWNFEHKLDLLEAEEQYSRGNLDLAKELYKNALAKAQTHRFLNDEALACELAAKFYYEIRDMLSSLQHYRLAHEKYCQWGAAAKATQLFSYINERFTNLLANSRPIQSNSTLNA